MRLRVPRQVLYYGNTYTFFACEDIDIEAVSTVEKENCVSIVTPFTTGSKVYFIGSFALKENCTIKGYGFVVDTSLSPRSTLTLADVSADDYIFNMSASQHTVGNQFIVSSTMPDYGIAEGKVVAYAIYEDENGVEGYCYSDVTDFNLESA